MGDWNIPDPPQWCDWGCPDCHWREGVRKGRLRWFHQRARGFIPLREMSLFRTRKESWNVKTFCKRVIPANHPFGGGGKVSFGLAGMIPTIELPLSFAIKHRFFWSFSFPENPPEHPEAKKPCCASNSEASPKSINLLRIYFWVLNFFYFFPWIEKKKYLHRVLIATCKKPPNTLF